MMTSKMLMRLFFRWVRQRGNRLGMTLWMVLGVGRGSVLTVTYMLPSSVELALIH